MGLFDRLKQGLSKTSASISEKVNDVFRYSSQINKEFYEELEEALIMADIGASTAAFIIDELQKRVKSKHLKEPTLVKEELREVISDILTLKDSKMRLDTEPSVVLVIGVNGVGKTTSIGKLAAHYRAEGKKVLLAAADTFRAAAIDQLDIWAKRADCDIIKHMENSDPASVVFDACSAAKARKSDILICDTAGRLHNKKNLMDELAKINRVIARELPEASLETLLVLDAATGQNAVNQAREFKNVTDISGIVLTKLDGTAKGGIVIAIHNELGIPVKYVGVGEGIDDLQPFSAQEFAAGIFDEA